MGWQNPFLFRRTLDADIVFGADEFTSQAARCRKNLGENIVDFFLPACLDTVNGGYMEIEKDGKFLPAGEKFVLLQARHVWSFSLVAQQGVASAEALDAARAGVEFIETHMRDRTLGGYFSTVTDAGDPLDRRKHICLNAFVLYAYARHFLASGDTSALTAAQELFYLIEDRARDDRGGGYVEFFTEDWKPITDRKEHNNFSTTGTKTLITHMHIMETYAELYRAWPDPVLRERIEQLIHTVFSKFRHPFYSRTVNAWTPAWKIVLRRQNLRANYGHDLESIWYIIDACETIGLPIDDMMPRFIEICDHDIKHGYDSKYGGFYSQGPVAVFRALTDKVWWVQTEALNAMLTLYRLTGDDRYYKTYRDVFDFIENHHFAPDGGWWATLHPDGTPKTGLRASRWQGCYHTARSMVMCAHILDELAAEPGG
jgi:mannobiose 2-epimerase